MWTTGQHWLEIILFLVGQPRDNHTSNKYTLTILGSQESSVMLQRVVVREQHHKSLTYIGSLTRHTPNIAQTDKLYSHYRHRHSEGGDLEPW